jgi:hypothetical protein
LIVSESSFCEIAGTFVQVLAKGFVLELGADRPWLVLNESYVKTAVNCGAQEIGNSSWSKIIACSPAGRWSDESRACA